MLLCGKEQIGHFPKKKESDNDNLNNLKFFILRLTIPLKNSIDTVVPYIVVNSFAVHVSKILFSNDVCILPVAGVVCGDGIDVFFKLSRSFSLSGVYQGKRRVALSVLNLPVLISIYSSAGPEGCLPLNIHAHPILPPSHYHKSLGNVCFCNYFIVKIQLKGLQLNSA